MKNTSVWLRIKNGRGQVKGYLEAFRNNSGAAMSVPGVSRYINGADFDLAKAKIVSE